MRVGHSYQFSCPIDLYKGTSIPEAWERVGEISPTDTALVLDTQPSKFSKERKFDSYDVKVLTPGGLGWFIIPLRVVEFFMKQQQQKNNKRYTERYTDEFSWSWIEEVA